MKTILKKLITVASISIIVFGIAGISYNHFIKEDNLGRFRTIQSLPTVSKDPDILKAINVIESTYGDISSADEKKIHLLTLKNS